MAGDTATPTTQQAAVGRGGTAVIVGAGSNEAKVEFNAFELFFMEKKLLGSYYGSADVRSEFLRLIRLWRAGRLDLDGMISRRLDISQAQDAFDAMDSRRKPSVDGLEGRRSLALIESIYRAAKTPDRVATV